MALKVCEDVIVEEIDGQLLMLDLRKNAYFGLNAVGLAIWRALEEGRGVEAAVDALVAEFEVERERAAADAAAFVRELLSRGFAAEVEA